VLEKGSFRTLWWRAISRCCSWVWVLQTTSQGLDHYYNHGILYDQIMVASGSTGSLIIEPTAVVKTAMK